MKKGKKIKQNEKKINEKNRDQTQKGTLMQL